MSRTNEPIWSEADHANGDEGHDGLSDCQEYPCDTDPTNTLSFLKLRSITLDGGKTTAVLRFCAVLNKTCTV